MHSTVVSAQSRQLKLSDVHLLVCTHDRAEASRFISTLYCPFRSSPLSVHRETGPVRVHNADLGVLNVSTVDYGGNIGIEPESLGPALIITTAIEGSIRQVIRGNVYNARTGASVLAVDEDHPRFEYQAGSIALKLRIPRSRLESLCWRMLGAEGRKPLIFSTSMREEHGVSERWLTMLELLIRTVESGDAPLSVARFVPSMEEVIMMTLLSGQPHNYSAALAAQTPTIAPRQWHRAIAYMEHNISDTLTLTNIAASAGCSIRSLTRAFRQFKGTTPMRHLLDLRLDGVHGQLLTDLEGIVTIESIALNWGFSHLGTFYQQYKNRFHETPSQTRRKSG